jgi:hypothetical protein
VLNMNIEKTLKKTEWLIKTGRIFNLN